MDVRKFFPFDYPPVPENSTVDLRKKVSQNEKENHKIEELRHLLLQTPRFRFPEDEDFLLQFLKIRKYDVKRAAKLCKNFLRKVHDCKFIFEATDLISLREKLTDNKCLGILPTRDRNGCVVLVIFAGLWDPEKITTEEMAQASIYTIVQCARSSLTQVAGFQVILDFSGYSLRHISRVSPFSVWHTLDSIQNCLPFLFKGGYILNENAFFDHLWSIIKLFLKKKLTDRCHFLGSKLENLYESFPPLMLPEELGGMAGSFSVVPWLELMRDFDEYFAFIKHYGFNPS